MKSRAAQVSVNPSGLAVVTTSDVQAAIAELDAAVGAAAYTDEQARDAIGTALVAGSGISVTVNDPSNTITIASTAGAAFNPSPVDDPANWTANPGQDYEFSATTSSLPSGWSWVNQGSATYDEAFGVGVIDHPGTAGNDVKGIVRAINSGTSWSATAKFSMFSVDNANTICGLVLRESSSGKLVTWGYRSGRTTELDYWTNPTTFNNGFASFNVIAEPNYVRIRKNSATSWDFALSADGVAWLYLDSARNISTFMTPDEIGVMVFRSTTSRALLGAHWFRTR